MIEDHQIAGAPRFTTSQDWISLRTLRRIVLIIALVSLAGSATAAEKATLSGYIRDAESNEELIGAAVFVKSRTVGVNSNDYGFYSLTLPPGEYVIRYSLVGYTTRDVAINLSQDIRLDVELSARPLAMDSIVVTAERPDENTSRAEMGSLRLSPAQSRMVPVLGGEQDILKTIQLMPGVQEAGEGNSGFHVRGGSVDQNLILLDEATVYSSSHLLGFFSVFNSDAIKEARLIKGSASAEYGGRLSSILDIKMKEGNAKRFRGAGGIGLISSRFAFEGPAVNNRSSFFISGRRTYFDLFLKLSNSEATRKTRLYFYDLNAKTNYHLGTNDRLFLSAYIGKDVLGYKGQFGIDWGNAIGTARWNHVFTNKLFLNSSLIYSRYNYEVGITNGDELVTIGSSITDLSLKGDFQFFVDAQNTAKLGIHSSFHTFLPGRIEASHSSINELRIKKKYALESAAYINHESAVSARLRFNYGLRYSSFALLGPGDAFTFDRDGYPIDTLGYSTGKLIKHYGTFEPRVAARYMLDEQSSAKISFARNAQYLHLLSASTTTTPFDAWHPSTKIVKPGIADQYAVGYFRNFADNAYETSLELYYKDLRNQVDYKNGADIYFNEYVESQLVFGKGRAYGLEFLIRKNEGRLTGWLSYTLATAQKKFAAINNGAWFSARQDRTHDVEIVGIYELGRRWTLGFDWVYYTGNAVTFPSGKYFVHGRLANLYTERNGHRMPPYHRLDLAFNWKGRRSSWNFSLFNAYGRRNAYAIEFRSSEDDPTRTEAVRIALFAFFPSITYNFAF